MAEDAEDRLDRRAEIKATRIAARAERRAVRAARREVRAQRRALRRERRAARRRYWAERGPAPRLTLGHWLPAILTGAMTGAIPAILISAELAADRAALERGFSREAYFAQVRREGPDCALELERDICLCRDFKSRAQAEAYVAARTALTGRPPRGRVGLYTNGSARPCAHLPSE